MERIKILHENIFTEIAKWLALAQIKREMPKIMKQMQEDPITVSSLQSLQYHAQQLQKILPDFCKRNPHSNLCKKDKK